MGAVVAVLLIQILGGESEAILNSGAVGLAQLDWLSSGRVEPV